MKSSSKRMVRLGRYSCGDIHGQRKTAFPCALRQLKFLRPDRPRAPLTLCRAHIRSRRTASHGQLQVVVFRARETPIQQATPRPLERLTRQTIRIRSMGRRDEHDHPPGHRMRNQQIRRPGNCDPHTSPTGRSTLPQPKKRTKRSTRRSLRQPKKRTKRSTTARVSL